MEKIKLDDYLKSLEFRVQELERMTQILLAVIEKNTAHQRSLNDKLIEQTRLNEGFQFPNFMH